MAHLPAEGLVPVLEELFRWDRTVRDGIYPKLEALPEGAWDQPTGVGRGSLHTILVHVVRTQRNWLEYRIWGEEGKPLTEADLPTPVELHRFWDGVDEMTFDTLAGLTLDQLGEIVEVPADTPVLKGGKGFRATRGEMLFQAATHAIYHRAQIRHGLTRLGISIPEPDYIFTMTETGSA